LSVTEVFHVLGNLPFISSVQTLFSKYLIIFIESILLQNKQISKQL